MGERVCFFFFFFTNRLIGDGREAYGIGTGYDDLGVLDFWLLFPAADGYVLATKVIICRYL